MATRESLSIGLDERIPDLEGLYQDLHEHPELSFQEERTAAIMAKRLAAAGFEVTTGVGGTGVVGVLRNGAGPAVLLRADMDALPVKEIESVPYRSSATGVDPDGVTTPVMHACGHDTHMTALIGVVEQLAARKDSWSGTVIAVCQPAEEVGAGARAMLADGFADRFPPFEIALGQHISSAPSRHLYARPGVFMAAADSLRITIHGRGGHGAVPQATIDPIVIASSIVLRLQTIVAREVAPNDVAVVTVASFHAGSKENVIPADAELKVNVRTFDPDVRAYVLDAIGRIVKHEAPQQAHRASRRSPRQRFPLVCQRRRGDQPGDGRVRGCLRRRVRARDRPESGQRGLRLFRTGRRCAVGVLELRRLRSGVLPRRAEPGAHRGRLGQGTEQPFTGVRAHRPPTHPETGGRGDADRGGDLAPAMTDLRKP